MIETPGILWSILFFALAIAPLIFIHEMGHYLVGRWCGVKAEVFSIGFGKPLAKWSDKRGTRWQIGWMPLGGYVRFAGDMTATSEPTAEWLSLPPEERNRTFQAKPVWQRALIVLAGPATNFLFAIIVFAGLFSFYGEPRVDPVIGAVVPGSAAAQADLRAGDRIVAIDGNPISRYDQIAMIVQVRANQVTVFSIQRGSVPLNISVTPKAEKVDNPGGAPVLLGRAGIMSGPVRMVKLQFWELPGAAVKFTGQAVGGMMTGLRQIIVGQRSVDELGGPVKMARISGEVAMGTPIQFLFFMTMISINLGFINLLPIPTLDGGHLVFYVAEAVRRKPVGLRAQEWAFKSGLVMLLAFMLFVTVNDLGLWNRLAGLIG
ncbi:RIP metalloprotease [Sphingomonas paeninsulae]|uniref:RIP metalloprotease n=1 Tax=Sphingomonas paeninsulae TaxID=2319844 RepID=A0A494TJM6_SPHPE|nr:M50 family metallopeptidase [Sphingomonas paeninsulae]AYJ85618.1 RIP metalloprotease [Sphingomonas paeninsulae]